MLQIPVIHPTHHSAIFQVLVKERCRSTILFRSFLGAYKVRESPVEPGRFDILSVQIYPEAPYNGPTTAGTFELDGSNYADCGLCLLVYSGCDSNLGNCTTTYFATSGSVLIESVPPQSAQLDLTIGAASFEEVTIDASTYVSTPVPDGALWCLELEVVRLASSGGNAGEGEACATSSDCGAGLECAATRWMLLDLRV